VPTIAWWPDVIPSGGVSDASWYHGDVPATAAELAAAELPDGASGDSFVAAMKGTAEAKPWTRKSPLYWECYEGAGGQAVRFGKWKAIRTPIFTGAVQLYDMSNDAAERRDYSQRRPDLTRHATNLFEKHHTPDERWGVKGQETAPRP
jgi:arylsulfatase A-like enzyme